MFKAKKSFLMRQCRNSARKLATGALALLLFLSAAGHAQDFQWAVKNGSTGDDQGFGIAADAASNTYVTGMFSGTVTFGSTTLTSAGLSDIFVAKYDASGSVVWAKRAGGTALDQGRDIVVDAAGNSYVTGFFRGASASFGSITLTGGGGAEIFVAKYDASGNEVWAKRAGGAGLQATFSITLDASGNSYIAGYIEGTATFGPGEAHQTMLTSLGGDDMIVAKYAANGDLVWAKRAGGLLNAFSFDVGVDAAGNSYVTGSFDGTATFGLGETNETTLASAGTNNFPDIFLAKYDLNGDLIWAKRAGDVNFDRGRGIRVDAAGNSYVTGRFQSMATFGSTTVTSAGNFDVFVAKYDANGNVVWVTRAGGTGVDDANNIAIDATGASYITGVFAGTASFGSTSLSSAGNEDMFAAKYDANGNLVWATHAGGTALDEGFDVAVDAANNSYFVGRFASSPAAFDALNLSSAGSNDAFVAKIASHCFLVTNTGDSGSGSLRQAILDANALTNIDASTPDTIKFNIPTSDPGYNAIESYWTISPTSDLDPITEAVIIDGYTQSGATPATTSSDATIKIALDGAFLRINGLYISAGSGSTIKGLAIHGFVVGILIDELSSANIVEGNFIGTDPTGTVAIGNGNGVQISLSPGNTVGGATPACRNIIAASRGSGAEGAGIQIGGNAASGNTVQGNYIGTDVTGTITNPTGDFLEGDEFTNFAGISVSAPDNLIGGTAAGEGNLISGNVVGIFVANIGNRVQGNFIGTDISGTITDPEGTPGTGDELGNLSIGVWIEGLENVIGGANPGAGNVIAGNGFLRPEVIPIGSGVLINREIEDIDEPGHLVQGNFIGTDATGSLPLPNFLYGIYMVGSASNNTIGGTGSGEGNIIAYNDEIGVFVAGGPRNRILGNAIFNNGALGIDITPVGVNTPNDPGDGDSGPNNLQNFPVLTAATTDGSGAITITGTFNSTPNTSGFRLEFFANTVCNGDQSGVAQTDDYGEGETFLGFTTVSTDGSGDGSFSVTLSTTVPVGAFITATATAPDNSTSEFSQCVEATGVCPAELTINNASAGVQALLDDPETDPDALAALEAAKDALTVALGHAQSEDLEALFYALREAADALEEAREDINGTDPIASSLADLARCIAEQKREAALECDPTPSGKMADDIEDGDNDLAAGDEEYNDGYFGDAIKDFRKAWEDYCSALARCEGVSKTAAPGHSESAEESAMPTVFALHQNYPNPFWGAATSRLAGNPSTTIRFDLPQAREVALTIYNIYGQRVRQLVAGQMNAGRHSVVWDATNDHGQKVVSGVYLYVIKAGDPSAGSGRGFTAQRKLILMK